MPPSASPEFSAAEQDRLYLSMVGNLRAQAQQRYSSELGYHGPHHEAATVQRSLRYRSAMLRENLPDVSSEFRTTVAASWHDAGYEEFYLEDLGAYFRSPEEYSMYLTREALKDDVDPFTISQITGDQLRTKIGERCENLGQIGLCGADLLPTMRRDRTGMRNDTNLLYAEWLYLRGEMSEVAFRAMSTGVLAVYHQVNLNNPGLLRMLPQLATRRRQMGINITAMFHDSVKKFGEQTIDNIRSLPAILGEPAMKVLGIGQQRPEDLPE